MAARLPRRAKPAAESTARRHPQVVSNQSMSQVVCRAMSKKSSRRQSMSTSGFRNSSRAARLRSASRSSARSMSGTDGRLLGRPGRNVCAGSMSRRVMLTSWSGPRNSPWSVSIAATRSPASRRSVTSTCPSSDMLRRTPSESRGAVSAWPRSRSSSENVAGSSRRTPTAWPLRRRRATRGRRVRNSQELGLVALPGARRVAVSGSPTAGVRPRPETVRVVRSDGATSTGGARGYEVLLGRASSSGCTRCA